MSNTSKIFTRVPVEVQNRNGFDQSHEHIFTAKVGTLVPIMCKEIMPNTTIDLGMFAQCQLPPMATDFYGRVDACFEAFFVPMRQLFGGFEAVLTHNTGVTVPSVISNTDYMPGASSVPTTVLEAGSLADYLGLKIVGLSSATINIPNILPFVCYHWVFDQFYKDSRVQASVFAEGTVSGAASSSVFNIQHFRGSGSSTPLTFSYGTLTNLADGVSLFSLRQRCYAKDYFTNATLQPQQGTPSVLQFATSVTGTADSQGNVTGTGTGSFTIQSLMVANSLQKWLQINNIAGNRFGDQQYAQFGIYPESYKCERPIYLGSYRMGVYNKSVYQTSQDVGALSSNPFVVVGTKYGSPLGVGDGQLVDKFHASEFGYLMVMASIVPHAVYSTGTEKKFMRDRVGDYPFPLLENVGDQPIYQRELLQNYNYFNNTAIFGYTQRFAEWKYEIDKVSGLMRDNYSLDAFALKRSFATPPVTQSTSFLEIPQNALDEVAASSAGLPSSFGGWFDVFFKLKTVLPLSAYSIPTLGDPKDTHTVSVPSGGVRL